MQLIPLHTSCWSTSPRHHRAIRCTIRTKRSANVTDNGPTRRSECQREEPRKKVSRLSAACQGDEWPRRVLQSAPCLTISVSPTRAVWKLSDLVYALSRSC